MVEIKKEERECAVMEKDQDALMVLMQKKDKMVNHSAQVIMMHHQTHVLMEKNLK